MRWSFLGRDATRLPARYDAFMSYSHAGRGGLVPLLQDWLERFATPWYKPRSLRIFRDYTSLAASGDLRGAIEHALAASDWLIVLASPEAAASPWVDREIGWWHAHRAADRVLIVILSGELSWDEEAGDWSDATTGFPLPPSARGMFRRQPLWVDLSAISVRNRSTGPTRSWPTASRNWPPRSAASTRTPWSGSTSPITGGPGGSVAVRSPSWPYC